MGMRKPSGSSIDQKLFNREYNLILNGEPSLEELLNDRETLLILNKFKQAKEEMFSKENEEYNKVLYRSIAELRRTNLEAFKDYLAGDMNVLWGHPDLAKHSYCRRVMLYCRRVRGLSIREISLLAGIGYDTYRKVEWGADCFVSVLERIADVLRTSLDTIAPVSEVKGIREYNLELYNIKDIGVNSVITNEIVNKGWVYSPKNDEKLNGFVDETSNKSLLLNNIVNEFENESKNIKTLKDDELLDFRSSSYNRLERRFKMARRKKNNSCVRKNYKDKHSKENGEQLAKQFREKVGMQVSTYSEDLNKPTEVEGGVPVKWTSKIHHELDGPSDKLDDIDMMAKCGTNEQLQALYKEGVYYDMLEYLTVLSLFGTSEADMVERLRERYFKVIPELTVEQFREWRMYSNTINKSVTYKASEAYGELIRMGMKKASKSIDVDKDDFIIKFEPVLKELAFGKESVNKQNNNDTNININISDQTKSSIDRFMLEAERFNIDCDSSEYEEEQEEKDEQADE